MTPPPDAAPDPAEADVAVSSPLQGTICAVPVAVGEHVRAGQCLVVVESMKMEHEVGAPVDGTVIAVAAGARDGETVLPGAPLLTIRPGPAATVAEQETETVDLDAVPAALAEVVARHAVGLDEHRPDAVAKRRRTRQRTARENVADLCDPGSFVEYGPLVIAAQRRRRPVEDLIERTPADGLVGGVGRIQGRPVVVMSYDYTVLAGTQGMQNHRKKDRLFELAESARLPVVLFAEGGGGRPGDTDAPGVSGLDTMAFHLFARLSGTVPLVGIASGRCFAGNAALLGMCDVVIATAGSNIGMGGPAMIEGGGLGVVTPDAIGPLPTQAANGVVDVAVADEAEAVQVARRYLAFFTHPTTADRDRPGPDPSRGDPTPADATETKAAAPTTGAAAARPTARGASDAGHLGADDAGGGVCADQRALRHVVGENRVRAYDMRRLLTTLADTGSVLELRAGFARGMITALARVDGRSLGIVANDPGHLGGAIDSDGADKAARFLQLCDASGIAVLSLCDTPGIMVGPEAEETALVRHVSRLFVTGANLRVPLGTIIVRKGYGLGAQAMAGGSFKAPRFCVAWPTGELGGMGLEGAVKLGFRRELEAIADETEREAAYQEMVARMYEHGRALNTATYFEIDDVIDPADSRRWITTVLFAEPPVTPGGNDSPRPGRPHLDTW